MAQTRTEIQNRYDAKNCKHYSLKLNVTTDADIIEKLSSVNGIQAYIKQAIRAYIAMDSHSVPVSVSDAAMETLKEQASETGKSVPDLVRLIVEEAIIRDYNQRQ